MSARPLTQECCYQREATQEAVTCPTPNSRELVRTFRDLRKSIILGEPLVFCLGAQPGPPGALVAVLAAHASAVGVSL